ncbi:MAG: glycosyltransferase family 39 protein [Oscillospiraceae bacterium]|nr:glycosyltransferase family 39 protein [Oscillospiraceae bacterium]
MNSQTLTDKAVKSFGAHPYLWMLFLCLFQNPFFLGSIDNIPNNMLWLAELLVLGGITCVILHLHRSGKLDKKKACLYGILAVIADFILLILYSKSKNPAIWHFAGGCALVCGFYCMADKQKFRRQLNSMLILGIGFFLKLYYILGTSVYTRQHDMGKFEGESGHAAYIEYLAVNHHLADFDVRERRQFYHPPLHHALSALWVYISETFLNTGRNPARESIQTLTLFYSMCIMITGYKILRHFKLDGKALYIPLILISFHPTFILFGGCINNDILSVVFILGAVLCTLKWIDTPNLKNILNIALCIGFGMMTKLSSALIAPPVALVFLIVLIRDFKTKGKDLFKQFVLFGCLCAPLGLWYQVRSYLKWKVPFNYVQEMSTSLAQYLGDEKFIDRITDFSGYQFSSVYEQWYSADKAGSYNEHNPIIALMKNALFGEYINENTFKDFPFVNKISFVLFWLNVLIAFSALICLILVCFRKNHLMKPIEKAFLFSFYAVMMVSIYKMSADYKFTCTMNFRYIMPTVILGALGMGLILKQVHEKDAQKGELAVKISGGASLLFAVCTSVIYLMLCYTKA